MKLSDIKSVKWTVGSHGRGNALDCFKELQAVKKAGGGVLEPVDIVDRARPKDNPLHDNFTWDDSEAASKFREEQARRVVRSIQIVMKTKKGAPERPVKAFVSVSASPAKETKGSVYVTVDEALEDPIMRDEVLSRAIREALSFRKKYAELSELSQVFIAIDETLAKGRVV
jgi:hypothetical protein